MNKETKNRKSKRPKRFDQRRPTTRKAPPYVRSLPRGELTNTQTNKQTKIQTNKKTYQQNETHTLRTAPSIMHACVYVIVLKRISCDMTLLRMSRVGWRTIHNVGVARVCRGTSCDSYVLYLSSSMSDILSRIEGKFSGFSKHSSVALQQRDRNRILVARGGNTPVRCACLPQRARESPPR